MKSKKRIIAGICAGLAIGTLILVGIVAGSNESKELYAVPMQGVQLYEESYQNYLESNQYSGVLSQQEITINLASFTTSEENIATMGEDGLMTEDHGTVTWNFEAKESGFYHLELGYIALPGTTSDIQRKIYLDGEMPYDALSQIVIKRWWQDETIRVKNGNEIRPGSTEVYADTKWFVEDYQRRNNEPLLFYLEKGKHTLAFEVVKEPLEITSLTFKQQECRPDYDAAIMELKNTYEVYRGENIIGQAERLEGSTQGIIKSSSSINIQKNYSDSVLEPYHPYKILYNTIGAENWAQPGDSITWKIEVEKEGLYELTFKGRQNLKRGVTSYRRLYINGEVPYAQMNAVGFSYSNAMNQYTVATQDGTPYLFYLKEGTNTITLENVMGVMGGIISQVEESMTALNQSYLKVIQLTGQVPDKFIDYEIKKKIPEFAQSMAQESENLYEAVDAIIAITGEKGENTSLLEKMAIEASWLAEDPESVIEELNQLKNNISALGTWLVNVSSMPLEVDYLVVSGEHAVLPKAQESFASSAYYGTIRFFSTFFVKNSQITEVDVSSEDSIKVWMASSGREQAQMIQNMIEESFTPNSDIQVNLQLIPVDVVLRAALAGNGPDVVIGLSQATLQDFAMRDAIVDLTKLEGYQQVEERFYDSVLEAAAFKDGVYGIPEQATFMMMFVRNDIFDELNLEVPNTWEEFHEMIPVLQKNNYNAYVPNVQQTEASANASSIAYNMNLYLSMVKQNGGDIFMGEGADYGIESGLVSDYAMTAFKDYTDFFTNYGLDVQVDFNNRFRAGEIPVGITGYTTFNTLEIFAPEIKGQWSFYPVPGVEQEDGSIDRTFIVDTVQSVIMAQSDRQEAAWEFIKWWTGTEAQLDYANSLEALMGTSARYAAADPEVLRQLPWSNQELDRLLTQFEDSDAIRAVPGSYMSTRMVQYSFNAVVGENANPRETLYLNIKDINQELTRKREELGLSIVQ